MKKNVASQIVGAQLIAKADGTPVTSGTTTVYVTLDGGTQATGTVGSGAATHEGNGYWTYAPSQAETNGDLAAFTFVNTNAVNATVQIYTSFPQTGDGYARLGAPAGASVSADVAAVKSDSGAIKTKTDSLTFTVAGYLDVNCLKWVGGTIPAVNVTGVPLVDLKYVLGTISPAAAGTVRADAGDPLAIALPGAYSAGTMGYLIGTNLNATVSSRASQTSVDTLTGYVDTEVAAIKAKTDNLPASPAATSDVTAVGSDVTAIKAKTDSLTFTVAGQVDANIQYVNDTQIQGTGTVGSDEWRKV